jgi:O-antigen/teichoic acid export membrane protein
MQGYYDRRTRQWRNTGASAYYGNALADFIKVGFIFLAILAVLAAVAVALVAVLVFGLVVTLASFVTRRSELRGTAWRPLRTLIELRAKRGR